MPSIHAHAAATAKHTPNPAQQARAADPAATGAAFGALVSDFARSKHAETPVPEVETTPAPPADGTGAVVDTHV